jgi:predicted DNA-binding transcriptional regulator AlpA
MDTNSVPGRPLIARFADIEAAGIVRSRQALKNLIDHHEFPPGFMLGPNSRAWYWSLIEQWLASRPVEHPAPRQPWKYAKAARAARGGGEVAR